MATVTDDERGRCLLDRPQRLGIMPTWWFWQERENWRYVRWPFALFMATLAVSLGLFEVPPLLALLTPVAVHVIALGSVEKYIRHQALKRRQLGEAALEALSEGRE